MGIFSTEREFRNRGGLVVTTEVTKTTTAVPTDSPNVAIVAGIERHAIIRQPSAVQCDDCKKVIHPDISRWRNKNTLMPVTIRIAAWLDYGWSAGKNERDYCGDCTALRAKES